MSIINDFKARFPEFDPALVDELFPAIEGAYGCYYGGAYSGCDKEVILQLCAHLFVDASTGGASGAQEVSGRSVGSVSISFSGAGAASGNKLWPFFGSTKYGRQYMYLISKNMGGKFV